MKRTLRFPSSRAYLGVPALLAVAVAACSLVGHGRPSPIAPTVQGRLTVLPESTATPDLAPLVVQLDPMGEDDRFNPTGRAVRIASSSDLFVPGFFVVGVRDTVVFHNGGELKHRLFSPDLPTNQTFSLDPAFGHPPVVFPQPGLKRFFCSLHPEESFAIYVSDAAYYALADREGGYSIAQVEEGTYLLSIWSDVVAGPIRSVQVDSNRQPVHNIWLDAKRLMP